MPPTKNKIKKIIALIQTKEVKNIRLAQKLVPDKVPEPIKQIAWDIYKDKFVNAHGRVVDADLEAIVFVKDEIKELNLYWHESPPLSIENIGQFVHLKWLLLTMNELTAIPKSVLQLKNLKKLSLQNNKLLSLPDDIGILEHYLTAK